MGGVVGIDPGLKGGIALLGDDGGASALPMPLIGSKPDIDTLRSILLEHSPKVVVLEKVHSMPKQGVASTFKLGLGYGMIQGALQALGVPFVLVTPQTWKKYVLEGTKKDKDAAVEYVVQRYPWVDLKPGQKRKAHDGMADALCIATYGREYCL